MASAPPVFGGGAFGSALRRAGRLRRLRLGGLGLVLLLHARGQLLARALGLGAGPVLREERRRLRGALDVVGGAHARGRRAQARMDDRRRHAVLGQDRHRRLADAHLREQLLDVVEVGGRVGRGGRLERLGVVGRERAQRVLDAVAELAEHLAGHVVGDLRDEEDADALRADQAHRLGDRLEEGLGGAVEEQVRLVEEEDELRLVEVAGLGQLLEELGDEPHERRREEPRLVLHGRQLEAGDDAAAVRSGADAGRRCRAGARRRTRCRRRSRARRGCAAARRPSTRRARRCPRAPPCRRPTRGR